MYTIRHVNGPERLDAVRRRRIDGDVIEKQMRRVRRCAHERDARDRTAHAACDRRGHDAGEDHRADAVREHTVRVGQQVERPAPRRAPRRRSGGQPVSAAAVQGSRCRRRAPSAVSGQQIGGPRDRGAGYRVSKGARHRAATVAIFATHRKSCDKFPAIRTVVEAKVLALFKYLKNDQFEIRLHRFTLDFRSARL